MAVDAFRGREFPVGVGVGGNGLFEEPVEEQAAAAGGAL
jgi:hypothetical protein